ncbi:hypothetical protein [Roseateles amylovorans]|uniref:Uncharacterized protein n=1 Tax=Roseateles amylovorans TaxID=2978473 RepID=A0ABY6B291_9BURK|nr:hypothetical protein [Roseateles amylovorans]UXH78673.1 hypothetical protein N4261_01665 [Roseateles amylovorans]
MLTRLPLRPHLPPETVPADSTLPRIPLTGNQRVDAQQRAVGWQQVWSSGKAVAATVFPQTHSPAFSVALERWYERLHQRAEMLAQEAFHGALSPLEAELESMGRIKSANEAIIQQGYGHIAPATQFLAQRNAFYERYDRGAYDAIGIQPFAPRFNALLEQVDQCQDSRRGLQLIGELESLGRNAAPAGASHASHRRF